MWTLFVLASAAMLWLLQLTLAPEAAEAVDPSWFGPDFLLRATLALSVLAGVLLLQRLLAHLLKGRAGGAGGAANTASDLLQTVVTIGLYLVATLLYLSWGLGLDVKGVLATSAILSVVIGLALQPTLGHLFAGVSIEIERPLRVGDYVKREEMEGQVLSLSWRSVSLQTERGSRVVIPNGEFNNRLIEVISADQPFRHQVNFNLASDLPPAQILRIATQVLCSGLPGICAEPSPTVVLLGTDPQTGTLRYAARLYTLEFLTRASVGSGFLERLWYALSREGLSRQVLWPTPELSLRKAAPSALRAAAGESLSARPRFRRNTDLPTAAASEYRPGHLPAAPALGDLSPGLQDILWSCAQTLHYGPFERCDGNAVALVRQGSVVEERAMDAQHAQTAILALVAQIALPCIAGAAPRLNNIVYQALVAEATLALGPLAHDLCLRIAALTADPHMAYHAVAACIPEARQRARFLQHVSAQPNHCLAEGDWLGWAQVLGLESDIPVCRASDACTLLVWQPGVLRSALKAASPADLHTLAGVLRDQAPGCDALRAPELVAWAQGAAV